MGPVSVTWVKDTARVVKNVLETTVLLDKFPNSCLEVQAVVLESNGSELGTLLNAVSVAVADAGVEMLDLVTACHLVHPPFPHHHYSLHLQVGLNRDFCLDPSAEESKAAKFEMIVAAHPSANKVGSQCVAASASPCLCR